MLELENKVGSDGKMHEVFVCTTNNAAMLPVDPNAQRDRLIRMFMKTELQDVINTCKQLGATDGKGGSAKAETDSSSNNLGVAAAYAEHAATKSANQAEVIAQKTKPAPSSKPSSHKDLHNYLKNHNVFWDLFKVAMSGNSSVFGILTAALGKVANMLEGNQYVTGIITQLNNDLKELVDMKDPGKAPTPAQQKQIIALVKDIEKQLSLLQDVIDPSKAVGKADYNKAKEAHDSMGPNLVGELKTLTDNYADEGRSDTGAGQGDSTGFAKMLKSVENGDNKGFQKFWKHMVNSSGKSSPSSGTTGIYSQTSSMVTSLNTSGSTFMARQNLDTKQLDSIEKVWTSGMSTDKSIQQSVVGNIAN